MGGYHCSLLELAELQRPAAPSASGLWKREMEMRGSYVVTEQSTFHPPGDPAPAMTSCCLTVKELTEQGGRDEGCLALPPNAFASEYVFF